MAIGAAALASPAIARATPPRAAQTPHSLNVGDRLQRFDLLKPGVRSYLRSQLRGDQHLATDIWRRETRIDTVDGAPRLLILQRWDSAHQPSVTSERVSVLEPGTFRPITHTRVATQEDGRRIEGFRFADDGVYGLADLPGNERAGFAQKSNEAMFNFETDLEMLQTLAWAPGYSVSIPFYHPGGGAPARYVWSVGGEERVPSPDGGALDCWIIQTDYNDPGHPPARFWLVKSTQQFLKLEAPGADHVIHRKVLLPG
ncbi:MAG: hypothetical protein EON90_04525 [Brevundimonas sp.]|nr:MAG: hypothetical protein EON90_04525 [Brevundimonas sp.]